jgi:putative SbcD/Mre11-related phosphoesterase
MMQHTEILPGVEIRGLTLYVRKEKTLILGDLHLGYEEELMSAGYLVPRVQYTQLLEHMKGVLEGIEVSTVVINGDLKHEFGRISEQEWKEVGCFLDFLSEKAKKIILVKGNHDTIMGPIVSRREIKTVPYFFLEESGIYVTHGHVIPEDADIKKAKVVVIGHDHPAVTLREGARTEKIKCFLKGKWNKKTLIQMPSASFLTEGTDVTKEKPLSPFMSRTLSDFEAYGVEGYMVLYFGKVMDLPH